MQRQEYCGRRPLRIQVSRTANKRAILNGDEQRMGASDGDDDMLARVSLPRPTHYPLISLSLLLTRFTCAYLFARSSRWLHEHITGGVNVCRTLTSLKSSSPTIVFQAGLLALLRYHPSDAHFVEGILFTRPNPKLPLPSQVPEDRNETPLSFVVAMQIASVPTYLSPIGWSAGGLFEKTMKRFLLRSCFG